MWYIPGMSSEIIELWIKSSVGLRQFFTAELFSTTIPREHRKIRENMTYLIKPDSRFLL